MKVEELERLMLSKLRAENACFYIDFNATHSPEYSTAREYMDRHAGKEDEPWIYNPNQWISEEEFNKSMELNSVWTAQWYPDTPISSHRIRASSLPALIAAIAIIV